MSITKSTIKSNSRNGTFYAMQNIWLKAVKYIMKREKTLALDIFCREKMRLPDSWVYDYEKKLTYKRNY